MGAGSKFDQPLTLIDDGEKVVACGPLNFYADDVSALVTIDLQQGEGREHKEGRGRARASGEFPNHHHVDGGRAVAVGTDEDEWMLTAAVEPYPVTAETPASAWGAATFVDAPPGPGIMGHGSIVYTSEDGKTHGFTWVNTGTPKPLLNARTGP